jgi:hypothetical protein
VGNGRCDGGGQPRGRGSHSHPAIGGQADSERFDDQERSPRPDKHAIVGAVEEVLKQTKPTAWETVESTPIARSRNLALTLKTVESIEAI